jgi:hypothetical protein
MDPDTLNSTDSFFRPLSSVRDERDGDTNCSVTASEDRVCTTTCTAAPAPLPAVVVNCTYDSRNMFLVQTPS